jgi:hypothetical protein
MKIHSWQILSLACALLLGPAGAQAATFTVNTTNDTSDADLGDSVCLDLNGKCSVRAAVMQANFTNAIGPSNTIVIPAGTYTLTRPGNDDTAVIGDLDIAQTMTLQGAGSGLTIIDGNGAVTGDRVFQILSSAKETSLSGMTIRNGSKVAGVFDSGGGLYWDGGNDARLHLTDVIFENNSSHYGGGLYLNYLGFSDVVTLDRVILRNNIATTAAGGGLAVNFSDFAGFDMTNCQVYGNTAFQGGGLYFQGSPSFAPQFVRIETTDIYANAAGHGGGFDNGLSRTNTVVFLNCNLYNNTSAGFGGAIENYGTLVVSNTALYANSAATMGGGIYNEAGTVTVATSTLSGNSATNGSGGAIFNNVTILNVGGTLNLFNSTIASNSAVNGLGGGVTNTSASTMNARNTIIAGNTGLSGGPDFAGTVASPQYDLIGNSSGFHTSGGPPLACVFNVDPRLGPLRDNGGPTLTHALLPGSPAIDAGNGGPTIDQRGAPRPVDDPAVPNAAPGDGRDIGAFELARPRLAIQKGSDAAVLSWPWYYGGFSVESSTNLGSSNAWTTVAGAPVVSGNQYLFTNSPISGAKFYRLKAN